MDSGDSNGNGDTHKHAYGNYDCYPDSNTHSNSDPNPDDNADGDAYQYSDRHPNRDSNRNPNKHTFTNRSDDGCGL
jgi:hypothetical protein